jgi:hypothetical protein
MAHTRGRHPTSSASLPGTGRCSSHALIRL